MTKQLRWRMAHPWMRLLEHARRRCKDVKGKWFKYYGAKGIRCLLTLKDVERIWFRDNAAALCRPSLDRIDATKDYAFDNCRIIEFDLNSRLAWDKKSQLATWGGGCAC